MPVNDFDDKASKSDFTIKRVDHHTLVITAVFEGGETVDVAASDLFSQLHRTLMGVHGMRLALASAALAWARYRFDDATVAYRAMMANHYIEKKQTKLADKAITALAESSVDYANAKGLISKYATIREALSPIVWRLSGSPKRDAE